MRLGEKNSHSTKVERVKVIDQMIQRALDYGALFFAGIGIDLCNCGPKLFVSSRPRMLRHNYGDVERNAGIRFVLSDQGFRVLAESE